MAQIVVIFSTKGGTGKTLLGVNLAIGLAVDEGKRVCVVDLDLHAVSDVSRMLGLSPQKAMVDWIYQLKKQPQAPVAQEAFVVHTKHANVDFLPGILRPQQSPHLDRKYFKQIFDQLKGSYDYIIVDAGRSFSEIFIETLNQANLILFVLTPDVLAIYQTKWAMDTLQFLQFPLAMIRIVLNRAESVSGISWQEVRTAMPVDIIAQIPSEGKLVGQAVNRGIPVVVDSPRSKIGLALKKLAHDLVIQEALFLPHKSIDELKVREEVVDKTPSFWQEQGLTEQLVEPQEVEERDEILILKRRIHERLIDQLNLKRLDLDIFKDAKKSRELREKADVMVTNLLAEEAGSFIPSPEMRKKLVKEILDEALGLGPLEDLMADVEITDIMVNNRNEVYVERRGRLEMTSKKFISNEQVRTIIERIIAPIGRRIDESVPMVDARLPDGSRVNAIIPPLALTGPTLTIRKFRKERFKIPELIGFNSISQPMADFIQACVVSRKNVIVSGGTGSGKTTILNILSGYIPNNERIITLEDAAELRLHQDHWVRLESRPPNIEGKGAITIRDLFRNTLRMRPDRIIIGECRGIETLDMLQAMNTGHDGSMTTIHANSTHDVLSRLDSMILMSGVELPIRAIREMIASAVDLIVHTARLSDGTRKVIQVTEIAGMTDELHIALKDVFAFRQTGVDAQGNVIGSFRATGYIPSFADEIRVKGIALPDEMFAPPA